MPISGNILITGGTGTLARAILRQAQRERWDARFTLYARSELRLSQTKRLFPEARTVIGDVRDAHAVSAAIAGHDVVIHAAAMKRIPECEQQPGECIATNVLGSLNVARACLAQGVKTAIAISTDKAAAACTTYGASKLLMEGVWRGMPEGGTVFTAVRYGNVAASNGSVIPIWRRQWNEGKPLTVTDARMTRFWMSPTAAVRLIETAAAERRAGTVWIPKMGALPIARMAEIVCPGARFAETGLRSTEKLHEDLVVASEPATETTTHFALHAGGECGHTYTSSTCRALTRDEFLDMLIDAEDLEVLR